MRVNSLFSLLIAPVAAIGTCYTTGPAFPPADHFLSSKKGHFKELGLKLDFVVNEVLKNPHRWNTSITSFAAQITTSRQTIWSNYYTAPLLGEYKDSEPSSVTGDTNFRIASISKSFTVYAILLENEIGLDDPITKYIPELLDWDGPEEQFRVWYPDWEKITIRSLASQLSGIAREGRHSRVFLNEKSPILIISRWSLRSSS
jgi:CubicO group peptidase (beta-lactamase class C family)